MAAPTVPDPRDRLRVLARRLLDDAGVPMLGHDPVVPLERGFLMTTRTPAGVFCFKFLLDVPAARLRAEAAVLSALGARVPWVPRLYDFGGRAYHVSRVWPRSGMAVIGTSFVDGLTVEHAGPGLRLEVVGRVADMHTILAGRPDLHGDVDVATDYQRLIQLHLEHGPLFHERGFSRFVGAILDRGVTERPLLPIHGDLRYENLIAESGRLRGIIDFSDARRSVREDEMGRLFQYLLYSHGLAPGDLAPLLTAYEAGAGYRVDRRNLSLSVAYNTLFRYVHDVSSTADRAALDDRVRRMLSGLARDPVGAF